MTRVLAILAFSVLFAHAPLSAGTIDSEQIHIVSVRTLDENGRLVCRAPTAPESHELAYLVSRRDQTPSSFTYSASDGGGIRLQFSGVPNQAKEIITQAASIWESYLVIDVPFSIRFRWVYLDKFLGVTRLQWKTGTGGSFTCLEGWNRVCLPNTLAQQILDRPLGANPSFEIDLNRNRDWYYGTDGNVPGGQRNLIRTVLHEIGHTLGFISGAILDHDERTGKHWKLNELSLFYDKFVWMPELGDLVDHHSERELFQALSRDMILWGRRMAHYPTNLHRDENSKAVQVNGGPVVLHSSKTQNIGILHLNQHMFGDTESDHLMTPYSKLDSVGEYTIGPVTLSMLYDLGWELREDPLESPENRSCTGTREFTDPPPRERRPPDGRRTRTRR